MRYNRTQIVYKDYLFDSLQECEYFKVLEMRLNKNEISNLRVHPTYVLQPPFTYFGKKVNGIEYTPDFDYIENGRKVAIEVKGIPTADFELRLKMWKYLNQNTLIKVMCYSKGTGWMEMNEYHKARKLIKKEQYEERIRKQIEMENEKKQNKILKMRNRLNVLEKKEKLTAKEIERKNEILERLCYYDK
jgi:hypothetical protein